jgi:hypothetical protein
MSNAEDRYLEYFLDGRLRSCSSKEAFLLGYHQAEKDLELGWEDMRELYIIFAEVDVETELCKADNIKSETLGYYQEVLKRFKERKEEL